MTEDRNRGAKAGRNKNGTFAVGNPGRPKGTRHRHTLAVEILLEGEVERLTRKAIELGLEGDTTALRLCLERVAPPRKDAPVQFDLPTMTTASEAAVAAQAVLQAVSDGEITPMEGAVVMGLVEQYRRTLETSELETRLKALEEKL
ncbi:MAG: hypothetical protein AAGF55_10240 [Pseudomonadota bacterium]